MAALLKFLRSIYDLDNLDTRFTNSSSVPYRTVVEARTDPAQSQEPQNKIRSKAQPSKWKTPEFSFYIIFLSFLVPYMFWIAYDVSRRAWPLGKTLEYWTSADAQCLQPRIPGTITTSVSYLMAGSRVARL